MLQTDQPRSKQGWVLLEARSLIGRSSFKKVFLVVWGRFLMHFKEPSAVNPGATWDLGLVKQLWLLGQDIELHHERAGKIGIRFESKEEAREWINALESALPQSQQIDAQEIIHNEGEKRPKMVRLFSKWGGESKLKAADIKPVSRRESEAELEEFKKLGLNQVREFITSLPTRPDISEDEEDPKKVDSPTKASGGTKLERGKSTRSEKGVKKKAALFESTDGLVLPGPPPGPPPADEENEESKDKEKKNRRKSKPKTDEDDEKKEMKSRDDATKPTKSPKLSSKGDL